MPEFNPTSYFDSKLNDAEIARINQRLDLASLAKRAELQKYASSPTSSAGPENDLGKMAQDTALAALTGTLDIGKTAYGLANIATAGYLEPASRHITGAVGRAITGVGNAITGQNVAGPTDEESLTIGQGFEHLAQTIGSYGSDFHQAAEASRAEAMEEAHGFVGETGAYLRETAKNPSLLWTDTIGSLPQMIMPASAAKFAVEKFGAAAIAKATKTALASGATKEAAAKLGQEAVSHIGEMGSSLGIGAQVAASNNVDVAVKTVGDPNVLYADMANNPRYQELRASGASDMDDRDEMGRRAGLLSAALSGPASLIASKLSGYGKQVGDIATGKYAGSGLGGLAGAVGHHVAYEYPMQFGEKVSQNLASRMYGETNGAMEGDPEAELTKGAYGQAASGTFAGAYMGVGEHAIGHALHGSPNQQAAKKVQVVAQADQNSAIDVAVQTGDVSAFTDPASKHFAPEIGVGALFANSQKADTTPETKQANLVQATQLVADLQKQHDDAVTASQATPMAQDEIDEQNAFIAKMKGKLALTTDPAKAEILKQNIASQTAEITASQNSSPAQVKAAIAAVKSLKPKLATANTILDQLKQTVKVTDDAVDTTNYLQAISTHAEHVDSGNEAPTDVTEAATNGAEKLIARSMAAPSSLHPVIAQQLADDASNVLTEPQRTYLRAFSVQQQAENTAKNMGEVTVDVMIGNKKKGKTGIQEYNKFIADGIATGDVADVQRNFTNLSNFATDHANKLAAAKDALALNEKDGQSRQIESDGNRGWSVRPTNIKRMSQGELTKNGGMTIAKGSVDAVDAIRAESEALDAAVATHKAAIALAFTGNSKSTEAAVSGTTQQTPVVKATVEQDAKYPVVKKWALQVGSDLSVPGIVAQFKINTPRATQLFEQLGQDTDVKGVTPVAAKTEGAVQSVIPAKATSDSLSNEQETGKAEAIVTPAEAVVTSLPANPTTPTSTSTAAEQQAEAPSPTRNKLTALVGNTLFKMSEGIKGMFTVEGVNSGLLGNPEFTPAIITTGSGANVHNALWFGPVAYEYSGRKHPALPVPNKIAQLGNEIAEKLGLPKGFFNSVHINRYTNNKGLGSHSDNEAIFHDAEGSVGPIATYSLGSAADITIKHARSGKVVDTIRTTDGSIYVMPDTLDGFGFQQTYKHAVGPSNGERISFTFRHVPPNQIKVPVKVAPVAAPAEGVVAKDATAKVGIVSPAPQSPASVAPQSATPPSATTQTPAAKYVAGFALEFLDDSFGGSGKGLVTHKEFTPEQKSTLSKVFPKVAALLSKEMDMVKFVAMTSANYLGMTYWDAGVVALNSNLFDNADTTLLTQAIAHELGHIRDGMSRGADSQASTFQEGGKVREQILKAVAAEPKLFSAFNTIFNGSTNTKAQIPEELYAQLHAHYITNPEFFNENAYLSEAAALFGHTTQTITGGVEEAQPSADGRGSTASVGQSAEQATGENPQKSYVVDPKAPGKLAALAHESTLHLPFQQRELLTDYFKQVAAGIKDATQRPLVMVKDFMTSIADGSAKLSDFLKEGATEKLDAVTQAKQEALFTKFKGLAETWGKAVQRDLVRVADDYRHADLFQYLVKEEGKQPNGKPILSVEQNVATAVAYGAMSAIVNMAGNGAANTDAQINAVLGRDGAEAVSAAASRELRYVGVVDDVLRNSWGQVAMSAMGMKAKDDNTPQNLVSNMESALGSRIEKLLVDQGILIRTQVPYATIAALIAEGTDAPAKAITTEHSFTTFLSLARDVNTRQLKENVQSIVDANKGTQGMLDKLFGVEERMKLPTFEPQEFSQDATKTGMGIPAELEKAIVEKMNEKTFVREDKWELMKKFKNEDGSQNTSILGKMAGVVDITDETVHASNQDSQFAKNEGIIRGLNNFFDYVGDVLEKSKLMLQQPIYFNYSVWSPQRVGIDTNVINPQSDKVHRSMLYKEDWVTQVKSTDQTQMDQFHLLVAAGFGMKVERYNTQEVILPGIKAKLDTAVVKEAIEALRKGIFEGFDLSIKEQEAIAAAVEMGGENFHTLNALIAVMYHDVAKSDAKGGDFTFESRAYGESDGINNGPILAHALLGAAANSDALNATMERGGIYTVASGITQFSEYKAIAGNQDLYENGASQMMGNLRYRVGNPKTDKEAKWLPATVNAIQVLAGELQDEVSQVVSKAGRDTLKGPTTTLVFGSGIKKAISQMGDAFVQGIVDKIQKAASDPDSMKLGAIIGAVNELTDWKRKDGARWISPNMPIKELMKWQFSDIDVAAIKMRYEITIGKATKDMIESQYGQFKHNAKGVTEAAGLAFHIYDALYKGMREEYVKELIQAEKDKPGTGIPVHAVAERTDKAGKVHPAYERQLADMTAKQEAVLQARLKDVVPKMHSAMSQPNNELDSGFLVGKRGQETSDKREYTTTSKFATGYADTGAKSTTVQGTENTLVEPGVSMLPVNTHGVDSAVSHRTQVGRQIINIHDAIIAGLANIREATEAMNANTWETLFNYSPMMEMHNTLARTINGMDVLMKKGDIPKSALGYVASVLADFMRDSEYSSLKQFMETFKAQAARAEEIKFGAQKKWGYIGQYAMEGASYAVTKEQRAAAAEREIAATKNATLDSVIIDSLQALDEALGFTKKLTAEQKMEKSKQETAEAEFKELGMSNTHAMTLLDHASTDESLSKELRTQMLDVLDFANHQGISVLAAIKDSLSDLSKFDAKAGVTRIISFLQSRFPAIKEGQWGGYGTSMNTNLNQSASLKAAFEAKPVMNATEAVHAAFAAIQTDPAVSDKMKQFYRELGIKLKDSIPADLKVRYVTSAMREGQVRAVPTSNSHGWYAPTKAGEIYILSTEFTHSNLSGELVLHELLHAALDRVIESKGKSAALVTVMTDLNNLHAAAVKYATENGLDTKYAAALSDVHELISWGMTNHGFQQDVMTKFTVPGKAREGKLVSGMKAFIKTLSDLFFGEGKQSQVTGMSVLISNVSGLLAESAKGKIDVDSSIKQARSMASNNAQDLSTHDIYRAIRNTAASGLNVSEAFDTHLNRVLQNIVHALHGPVGAFKAALMHNPVTSAADIFAKAIAPGGVAPFASKILASPLKVSEQEAFVAEQVEVTVREAIDQHDSTTSAAYRTLLKLYEEVRTKIQPKDFHVGPWASATTAEIALAQSKWDFIFKAEASKGNQSDYLSRFAALGLAHEGFNKLLQVESQKDVVKSPSGFFERLRSFFDTALMWFNNRVVQTYSGQHIDARLNSLVEQLVSIEAKKRIKIAANSNGLQAAFEEKADHLIHAAKEKLDEFGQSGFFQNSGNTYVKATGTAVSLWAGNRADALAEQIGKLGAKVFKEKQAWAMKILTDVRGVPVAFQDVFRKTKQNEQMRQHIVEQTALSVMNAFKGGGKDMKLETQAALSAMLLRTDAHVLLGKFSMDQLHDLINDKAVMSDAIKTYEAKLSGFDIKFQHYFKKQAKALGYNKVTGMSVIPKLMMTAGNIANMYLTPYAGKLTAAEHAEAEPAIDVLATLHALSYADSAHRNEVTTLLRSENQRNDGNGIENMLVQHGRSLKEAQEKLFGDSEALRMKGYLPEQFNPHKEIRLASARFSGQDLMDQGYSEGPVLRRDATDPDQDVRRMYVTNNGGLASFVSGMLSTVDNSSRGTNVTSGNTNPHSIDGQQSLASMAHIEAASASAVARMFRPDPSFDPAMTRGDHMVPLLNSKGEAANYRYMMHESTKDTLLERDNRFAVLLGKLAGNTFDKESAAIQNRAAVQLQHDQYIADFAKNATRYIRVSATSTAPEIREVYRLMSDSTKKAIKDIWGASDMLVRDDLMDITFGYRKFSMSTMFDKDPNARNSQETAIVKFTGDLLKVYGSGMRLTSIQNAEKYKNYELKAAQIVRRNERVWQEIMKEIKSNIVIKGGVTMLGNISSNDSLLMIHGVPRADIIKGYIVGWKGAIAYKQDKNALFQLENQLKNGVVIGQEEELKGQIVRLKDALERNPVHVLMEEGLDPSIVEDLGQNVELHSFKTKMQQKLEGFTNKIHPGVRAVANQLYMGQDTGTYKALSKITQLSDFVARYTLYQHLTTRNNKPMGHKEAIQETIESFINYDYPMQRGLQYMDDTGITMFTKYFLRIQRVLTKLAHDHPFRFMSAIVLNHYMHVMPIVTDSAYTKHMFNNPINTGAFQFFNSIKELADIRIAGALFR